MPNGSFDFKLRSLRVWRCERSRTIARIIIAIIKDEDDHYSKTSPLPAGSRPWTISCFEKRYQQENECYHSAAATECCQDCHESIPLDLLGALCAAPHGNERSTSYSLRYLVRYLNRADE